MQTLIRIYEHNREMIEKFLIASLHKQHLKKLDEREIKRLFQTLKSLELVYGTDKNLIQNTQTITDIRQIINLSEKTKVHCWNCNVSIQRIISASVCLIFPERQVIWW